jgi:hypothetical protein
MASKVLSSVSPPTPSIPMSAPRPPVASRTAATKSVSR